MSSRKRLNERDVLRVCLLNGATIPCALCKEPISLADVAEAERDHFLPVALGGTDDLANQGYVHGPCHKAKSRTDLQQTRKADRQKRKHKTGRSSGKKQFKVIKSRGFDTRYRKKLNGDVERVS